ncbi:MAG: chemotaxis-specific protein-glutamate methyltransferase CheB [Magnetococcus sp. MYC-9]
MINRSLKVLVVDDTTTYRMIVRKAAEAIAGVEVVDFAANGRIAMDKLSRMAVDVVLLDVEMPEMDGLTTLRHITEQYPKISVVMVSGASHANANIVVECLNAGAFDFVTKPLESDIDHSRGELISSLKPILSVLAKQGRGAAAAPARRGVGPPAQESGHTRESATSAVWQPVSVVGQAPAPPAGGAASPNRSGTVVAARSQPTTTPTATSWNQKPGMVLIGASTGGPAALTQVLNGIGPALPIPMLIVQHMPPMFTTSLAAQLSRTTGHAVQEAAQDQEVRPGKVLLAPGGRHLSVKRYGTALRAVLNDGPKVNGCRPAVDVLFLSVMASFADPILAVILTGMGTDGANGVKGLKRMEKTYCLTQSRESCVVYGMPRAVVEMGLSDAAIPLTQIGNKISELCR